MNFDLATVLGYLSILPHGLRRYVNGEPLHMHGPHMGRLQKQAEETGMKIESLDGDDRSLSSSGHDVIRCEDPQPVAGNR